MSKTLTLEILRDAVKNADALRCVTKLEPVGGPGDKVFPPTYLGGVYATETRLVGEERVPCVVLDSVQSQANRMECSLLQAWREGRIKLPVITVDFSGNGLGEVGRNFLITSLDAPHRIADAILRDSQVEVEGRPVLFGRSEYAARWGSARPHNATELFRLCPTALVFGIWGSPEKPGGLGPKFARAIVSEIVAINVEFGVKTSSRIDPLGVSKAVGPVFRSANGDWTLDPNEAVKGKGGLLLFGKSDGGKDCYYAEGSKKYSEQGKPSAANHGNIPPSVSKMGKYGGAEVPLGGGVTMDHAVQSTVLSLSALRRLEFPTVKGNVTPELNLAARTALAALGVCAATLARTDGDLRSRCQLRHMEAPRWEIIAGAAEAPAYDLSPGDAAALLESAAEAARDAGLPWEAEEIKLKPSPKLVELVRGSQAQAGEGDAGEGEED